MAESAEKLKFAIVLSGGGARGAYEAGVFHYLRTGLPKEIAKSPLFSIYCGTSVGAINSSYLASWAHDPIFQGAELRRLWQRLRDNDIYHADVKALTGFLVRSGFFMAANFFGLNKILEKEGRVSGTPFPFKSVLDTTPFIFFLRRNVAWNQIHRNIERGVVDAVAISATHMRSGELALFIEKHPGVEFRRGGPDPIFGPLSPKHVLASAAIPLIFPIIRINRQYFGDGSLRQNTPMSPAIHLGANRILVVGTHSDSKVVKPSIFTSRTIEPEPTMGDILGTLLDALFVDKLEYDLEQMRRINFLINDFEDLYGPDAVRSVNAMRRNMDAGGKEVHEVRKIFPFVIAPSQNIGKLASEHFNRLLHRKEQLTPMQKFFAKAVEGSPDSQNDLVSYLLFDGEYLENLIQLGYEDARREHDRLVNFFSGQPLGGEVQPAVKKEATPSTLDAEA